MGLLSRTGETASTQEQGRRVKQIFVRGVRYSNAAAKFWPSLIDEVRDFFPDCTAFELAAAIDGGLEESQLFPEIELERSLPDLYGANLRDLMRRTIAELEMIGPPGAVRIRITARDAELHSAELPLDCIDAEIFPYMVVWLLEWGGIPASAWKSDSVRGEFRAEDSERGYIYDVRFTLTNKHLSEGLYRTSVLVESSPRRPACAGGSER